MKKLTSLTAATFVALALVGCSQDGVVNEAPTANQAIEFGTYLGRDAQGQTRASVVDLAAVKTGGFGVFAYYTGKNAFNGYDKTTPNFMYNQKVTYTESGDSGEWTYTPKKYWPNNAEDKVSFVAYAPHDASSAITTDESTLKIKYTVAGAGDGTEDKSKDLLYAGIAENKTKMALTEKVTFNFQHALARIGFTVQGAIDQTGVGGTIGSGTTITVKKVILSGSEHIYTAQNNVTPPGDDTFYKSAKLDLLTGAWSNQGDDGKLSFTLDSDNFVGNANVDLTGDQAKPTTLNNENSYLMIIPQVFKTSDGAEANTDNLYVYVEYTVKTTDSDTANNKNDSTITNYISTPVDITFEKGKAYNINLVLGMNSVDLAVSDNISWGDAETSDVNLPANN